MASSTTPTSKESGRVLKGNQPAAGPAPQGRNARQAVSPRTKTYSWPVEQSWEAHAGCPSPCCLPPDTRGDGEEGGALK